MILSPWREGDDPIPVLGQPGLEGLRWHLAPGSLVLREGPGPCPLSEEQTFAVKLVHEQTHKPNGQRVGVQRCPHCREPGALMFIGSRAATLSSVAIDEVFGSVLNDDPKLLAFTDSVQDASHRAGFFSARTYHFTLRTALQHLIDAAGEQGVPVPEVGPRLLDHWAAAGLGRPGSIKQALATLVPPDLREYAPYLAFRDGAVARPPAALRAEIATRLTWEAASEFSLLLTHGRTMELHASATLGWAGLGTGASHWHPGRAAPAPAAHQPAVGGLGRRLAQAVAAGAAASPARARRAASPLSERLCASGLLGKVSARQADPGARDLSSCRPLQAAAVDHASGQASGSSAGAATRGPAARLAAGLDPAGARGARSR
ncbi:hypothetical protein CKO40_09555 [Halochromatium glycolicum]|uniref:Uncharacterized protein n=1 Tax=Halochromatium glycolicum TaxID=85075 RepID=A0AAJ0U3Y2_9GAMM|nr:hypothetical protein [Halochromatium glycolicum]